jgi:hypothetical protein
MDDLLTAFRAEVSNDLDACASDLDRLRSAAADPAAVADLHRLFSSIHEMSVVLGQRRLSELASQGAAALEAVKRGDRSAERQAVAIVAGCIGEIRAELQSLAPRDASAPPVQAQAGVPPRPVAAATTVASPRAMPASPPKPTPRRDARAKGRRWFRPWKFLLAGGATVGGAVAAAVIVVLSTDLNDYRDVFEDTIESVTGRQVTIGGIDLAVSLRPKVVFENVTLANAPWGSRPDMVAAGRLEVQMALLPLLRGEFEAQRFILHDADILLEVDASGRGNWALDLGDADAEGSADATTLPRLGRLEIKNSTVSYRDAATGETETFELRHVTALQATEAPLLELDIETVVNGQPVDLAGAVGALQLLHAATPYPLDLTGEVAGLAVAVKGEIAQPLEARGYSLALTASGPSLAGLGSMLAVNLPSASPVRLAGILEDADGAIRIRGLNAQIGNSDAAGEIMLRPGKPNWQIEADLAADHLDLQDFIDAPAGTAAGLEDPRLFSSKPLPYRWMGRIDIAGKVTADRVVHGDTTLTEAALDAMLAAGRLTLEGLRFGYAGGEVAIKATGDATGPEPLWTMQGSGRGLAGGDMLQRLFGLSMVSGGQADFELNVAAGGGSLREIAQSLSGTAAMNLTKGRLTDDLMELFLTDLRQVASLGSARAELRCLTAIFDFKEGNGRTRSFVADTGAAVVGGTGTVSLRNEAIDMTFDPSAKDVSLAALSVPVHVRGPLGGPSVTPDPVRATANVAGSAAGLATGGLAGAVLGLVGVDAAMGGAPIGTCAAIPATANTAPAKAKKESTSAPAPQTATTTPAPVTQDATTQGAGTNKSKKKSTTDQILDEAGAVVDSIGTSIGNVFSGSSSSSSTSRNKSQQGNKSNR